MADLIFQRERPSPEVAVALPSIGRRGAGSGEVAIRTKLRCGKRTGAPELRFAGLRGSLRHE
ncbi:hypothetical protein XAP412_950065 [Xanthomonas phaseoli pv. phaseoli]|uniref:Uncharacterized protein n=1 Tax=Xanthomonas campestris pv. phaseoli TaxID=317013 RepID=A0AB38E6D8_XANCH|nr:hypothetical protein XAP6984_980065 [Xanthomonas phaseoli pv. phaseoli]SON91660.1 hypothetical protein XAP412_950065 [Xanthomonas phaseoli pv. phaseoli]SON93053.1 hypothetical protein XAP7430_970065 [Xanthomonas phaseoli pv. phaseoli]